MNQEARNVEHDHVAAIDVEDVGIFDAGQMPGTLPGAAGQPPVTEMMTLSEAVARLGISERTIRRRLKAGTLQSTHDENGKLLIACQAQCRTTPGAAPDTARQMPVIEWSSSENEKLWQFLDDYKHQVQEQAEKIETLRARNGYLEAQLEFKTTLLEDHSKPWFRRFWKWFTGRG